MAFGMDKKEQFKKHAIKHAFSGVFFLKSKCNILSSIVAAKVFWPYPDGVSAFKIGKTTCGIKDDLWINKAVK